MDEKKYTVVCNGTKVEVTKEVYKIYVTDTENEARKLRRRKKGVIKVDSDEETIDFVDCPEDSIERIMELGIEFEDTSFSIEALDTAVMVDKALDKLSFEERYIIEALFFNDKTEQKVADELGIAQKNVHKKKVRILAKLAKLLSNE